VPLAVYMHDELLAALQEWVQAVCGAYDVSVQNFTSCFGDGVVLCLLVSLQLPGGGYLCNAALTPPSQMYGVMMPHDGRGLAYSLLYYRGGLHHCATPPRELGMWQEEVPAGLIHTL
jgi:hypothetical protein